MPPNELLPCPFCGDPSPTITDGPESPDHRQVYCRCGGGGAITDTEAEAIAAWNTRAESSELARLRTAYERLKSGIIRRQQKLGRVQLAGVGYRAGIERLKAELARLRAENERLREVDVNKVMEDFIGSMEWREETSKEIKNLVIDNLKGFAILVGMRLSRSLETQPRESPDDTVDR